MRQPGERFGQRDEDHRDHIENTHETPDPTRKPPVK
jgi:hypothetical protein